MLFKIRPAIAVFHCYDDNKVYAIYVEGNTSNATLREIEIQKIRKLFGLRD